MIRSYPRLLLLLTLPCYLADQATKWAVLHGIEQGEEVRVVVPGFFELVHWRNTGAAFSMFSNSNLFFTFLSAAALLVLAALAWKGKVSGLLNRLGWGLILAGILGNLTDRLLHGSVVDFLLFDLHVPFANPWPAFNVADACIFIAAALLIWQSFREARSEKAQHGA